MGRLIRVLSIDGGGIRGILPGKILAELEKKLQEKSNDPEARIADYFDLVAGTSTGGILTCMYLCPDAYNPSRPRFSALQALDIYLKNGDAIFQNKVSNNGGYYMAEKYDSGALEGLLKKYFKEIKLSQLLKPCIIPAYNIKGRNTHFFTQQNAVISPAYDYLVWETARAAAAAPAYFEPARVHSFTGESYPLVDGGVFANNPSLCAYTEACQLYKKNIDSENITPAAIFMLSIGTGNYKRSYDYHKEAGWGEKGWVEPVLDILLAGANDTVDFELKQIFTAAGSGENYIRIEPEMGKAVPELDNISLKNIAALKEAGAACAAKHNDELEKIADLLLKNNFTE